MDEWVNPKEFINKQNEEIKKKEAADFLDMLGGPVRDIFGYLKDNAPLKPWQQDIISMLYEESLYFSPQRATKMANEGWASYVDFHLMCEEGMAALGQEGDDCGIWHYADHKLGGKYSQNPYKLGFELFMDIRSRWDKGQFGQEWENCTDMREKEKWNKHLNLGKEKIFEVRKHYNDYTMIQEFFTPEFCEKKQFFEWQRFPNGEYKIIDRDFKSIKKKLLQRYLNGGLPDIRLADPNHLGKGWFFMQHVWDGRPIYDQYARETIISLFRLWKNVVVLATRNRDGVEYLYICNGPNPEKDVHITTREDYEKDFLNK
jgi:stage V sporulation protein R